MTANRAPTPMLVGLTGPLSNVGIPIPAEQQPGLIAQFFSNVNTLTFRELTAADIHPVALNILNVRRDGQLLIPSPRADMPVLPGNGTFGREYLAQQVIPTESNGWSGSTSPVPRGGGAGAAAQPRQATAAVAARTPRDTWSRASDCRRSGPSPTRAPTARATQGRTTACSSKRSC